MILIEDHAAYAELTASLNAMESRMLRADRLGTKTAVFDLDNTLLEGDIGDAVFAHMLQRGYHLGLTWDEYQELQRCDAPMAFKRVVSGMKGLSKLTVEEVTLAALAGHKGDLVIGNDVIPIPRPHGGMREFIRLLHWRGYRTLVVSASNQISVRLVAREYFGIPETDSFGIDQMMDESGTLTGELIAPVPVWNGKADLVQQILGSGCPVITAGDSQIDLPMLRMCDRQGFVIWAGGRTVSGVDIRRCFPPSQQILNLPRTTIPVWKDHS